MTKPDRESAGFFDASIWETARKTGAVAVKRLINSGLDGTSTTCILIGSQTYSRPWVRYEILKSFKKGNAIFAVHINSIRGKDQLTKVRGPNPLKYVGVTFSESGATATLHEVVNGNWVEYSEIDGSSSYRLDGLAVPYRGNGYNLSNFYYDYDWTADDCYNNFNTWVGS